jgi:hypothetical protein
MSPLEELRRWRQVHHVHWWRRTAGASGGGGDSGEGREPRLEFGVVTNGFNLRGAAQDVIAKHATFVRVSLDAGTPETHQFTHGTPMLQFHQILANIRATREKAGDDSRLARRSA